MLLLLALSGAMYPIGPAPSESLDLVAEHILEIPMDMRHFAFLKSPADLTQAASEWQLGYGQISGAQTVKRMPMAPSFSSPATLPVRSDVRVDNVSGSTILTGLLIAIVRSVNNGARFLFGMAIEPLNVGNSRVDFETLGPEEDFRGSVDYTGTYSIVTPFVVYEGQRRHFVAGWSAIPSAIAAWPLPRSSFKGKFSGPIFDIQSDTDADGNGKHIPDPYLGIGYTLEHREFGFWIDLGASLDSYFVEPVGHKSIDQSIFVSVSMPFQSVDLA